MSEFGKELEDYFCKFTFGQFVTLILLELVTLFFVFYLGARYGPDLIGGHKETAGAKEQAPGAPTASAAPAAPGAVNYTYPERLASSPGEAIRVKPSGVTAKEYEERDRRAGEATAPTASAAPTAPAAPIIVPAPERVPATLPITPPIPVAEPVRPAAGKYTVQVGSYPTAQEAALAVERWKGKGYQTFMTVGEIPKKGTWYRVRIGRFKDRTEAGLFLKKFKQREKTEGLVVLSKS